MPATSSIPEGAIITGCALVDPAEGRTVWGDLWSYGNCYVFNAVVFGHEAAWQFDTMPHSGMNQLIIRPSFRPFFERRGVIVIPHEQADLNPAAFLYLFPKGQ